MTTYQRGREPAGAPVTYTEESDGMFRIDGAGLLMPIIVGFRTEADDIARLAHAAAEWRNLAEEMGDLLKTAPLAPHGSFAWRKKFDALKETFGD